MDMITFKRMLAGAGAMSLLATGTAFAHPLGFVGMSTDVSASVRADNETIKAMKNEIKDFRARSRMMRKELRENGRSNRKTDMHVNANVDIACAKTEVTQRETALLAALEAYYTSWKAALQKRQASLEAAWSITVEADRAVAIKAAWSVYASDMKAARTAFHDATKAAWKSFQTDIKANCKATANVDVQGQSMDTDEEEDD